MNKMIRTEHEGLRLVSKVEAGMLAWFKHLTPDDIGREFYYDRVGGPPWIVFITDEHETIPVTRDGPVSEDEHFARLNVYPASPAVGERWEIDEDTFMYFFEVLPPMGFTRGLGWMSFLMSEMHSDNVTSKYTREIQDNGKYRYFHEWAQVEPRIRMAHEMGY